MKNPSKWFDFESEARTWRAGKVAPNEFILLRAIYTKGSGRVRFYVHHKDNKPTMLTKMCAHGLLELSKI